MKQSRYEVIRGHYQSHLDQQYLEDSSVDGHKMGDISITLLLQPKGCQNSEGRNCGRCELCQKAQPRAMLLICLQFNLLKPPSSPQIITDFH